MSVDPDVISSNGRTHSRQRRGTSADRTACVALPATCGELVQGTLDGVPCLVSCPIGYHSLARIYLGREPGWDVPCDAPKAVAALQAGLAYLGGQAPGGRLWLCTEVPRGRGYGSSTADIGAALYALSQAMGRSMTPEGAARLAVSIEPSDSTLFPGLALFAHRDASFHHGLGPTPPLDVVVIDPGGEVDTLAFNRIDHREALCRLAAEHRAAFGLLGQGLEKGDREAVGEAATLSARLHQAILPNPLLDRTLALARVVGALGVCRAHSGTLLGLLLDSHRADPAAVTGFVAHRLPDSVTVIPYPMVDGGPRYTAAVDQAPRDSQTVAK